LPVQATSASLSLPISTPFAYGAKKAWWCNFNSKDYDPEISEFVKIGNGSLGGKARGLAFVANLLRTSPYLQERYPDVTIQVPRTLVITTEGFDAFVSHNGLDPSAMAHDSDDRIAKAFVEGEIPPWLAGSLCKFLEVVHQPLSIRSSGLLEDVHNHPFTGLYKTYMVPNNHADFSIRCNQLLTAVKLVYASTWFRDPKQFLSGTAYRIRRDQMAVIIQQAGGQPARCIFLPGHLRHRPIQQFLSGSALESGRRGCSHGHGIWPGHPGRGTVASFFTGPPPGTAPVFQSGRYSGQRPAPILGPGHGGRS
jgi:hypothetical protein